MGLDRTGVLEKGERASAELGACLCGLKEKTSILRCCTSEVKERVVLLKCSYDNEAKFLSEMELGRDSGARVVLTCGHRARRVNGGLVAKQMEQKVVSDWSSPRPHSRLNVQMRSSMD